MQPQDNLNNPSGGTGDTGGIVCSECGSPMPQGMRFCRACGHRLGEGPAEYTETVRFPHAPATGAQGSPFMPNYAGAIAQQAGAGSTYKKKRRISGMAWIIILIAALFVLGGVLTAVRRSVRRPPFSAGAPATRSYFGVDGFSDADGRGVTFRSVEPPDSPADKAGLVGGDIITSFDGQPVNDRGDMMSLLAKTPIGKTVEVTYLRDGELKKTSMTTFSEGMSDQLEAAFDNRPGGWGQFGFDDDDSEVVPIPGTKMHGVKLDGISSGSPSGPAALAGIQDGDIVIEFDGTPIRTVRELVSRVRRVIPYTTVKVKLLRGTQEMEVPVKIGKRG